MDQVLLDKQPGVTSSGITGTLTLTKTGTTARTVTFPDAAITVARTDAAQTFTGQSTFTDGILTTHADASTSAGVHIGNATHQDVAIFGAGGSQGTTFSGQINGTSLALSGAASCTTLTASSKIASSKASAAANITDANCSLKLYDSGLGAGLFGMQTSGSPYAFQLQVADATMASQFPLSLNPLGGVVQIVGTAPGTPGATEVLIGAGQIKAGAGVSCASLTVAAASYIYLRGDASTDGSVRMSSPSAGVMITEARIATVWTEIGRFG
jgi:hypothetical protein